MNSMTHNVVALLMVDGSISRCTITSKRSSRVQHEGDGGFEPPISGLKIDVGFPRKNLKAKAFDTMLNLNI